jgi:iron complex transport system substrate-binding protein
MQRQAGSRSIEVLSLAFVFHRKGNCIVSFPPERIVCLTEETVETLYLLGEDDRIVGVSGYAVRPPQVRKEKPRVSAFISADIPKILALKPDIVLTFSDLQADIVASLIREGIEVHAFNQRTVTGILDMIRAIAAMVGVPAKGESLAAQLAERLEGIAREAQALPRQPKIYFEEWNEPMITGIGWVSELIQIAGGIDVFGTLAKQKSAKDRIVAGDDVIAARPDIIIGSWCGKKFRPEQVRARPGFDTIPAVQTNDLYEIKSTIILQPGPAALTDGVDALQRYIRSWSAGGKAPAS